MAGRVLIGGTNSGCGKTTVTLALLSALKKRGRGVCAFKCGPDYIDPMFHRKVMDVPSENLDPYFSTADQLKNQLASATGIAVIEGVMGYYDGIGTKGDASTYHVALQTDTPVILVINTKGMYTSAGAILKGFCQFKANSNICGVIFNGVSPMVYEGLAQVAADTGIEPLGCLPHMPDLSIESRHLGLVTADEISGLQQKLSRLGALAEEYLDIDRIIALVESAAVLGTASCKAKTIARVRIGVAKDEAFCFLYEENLRMLESLGCELCFFSPLRDSVLPGGTSGLYLPGGYPELYKEALSGNTAMLHVVKAAVEDGMPTVAECGGFLYLHSELDGCPMADVVPAKAFGTKKLQRFGYVRLTAQQDNLLAAAGQSIRAHEFHYYDSTDSGNGFTAEKASGARSYSCVHISDTLYAGFPHLYFPANPQFAQNFVRKTAKYAASKDFGTDTTG